MPRYFFHYRDRAYHKDKIGVLLSDDESAWVEGMRQLRQTISSSVSALAPGEPWRLEISGEAGDVLFSAQLLTADYRNDRL